MQLIELIKKAAEQGIASIDPTKWTLIPFTMVPRPDITDAHGVTVTRFAAEVPEQALQQAQASLRPNSGIPMYVLAWRGNVTIDGREWDAVLIEAGESELEEATIYAQCYEQRKPGLFKKRRAIAIGELIITHSGKSRLWGPRQSDDQSQRAWETGVAVSSQQRQSA